MSATSRRKKLSATFWSKILEINSMMGRANGKPVLSDEDLEFIAKHTAVSRDQIDEQYELEVVGQNSTFYTDATS